MNNDDVPPLDDSENEDSDEWEEMEESGEQTTCLFCSLQFHTIAVALDHCRTEHNFDLLQLKIKYNMDCYSYIKMINYIRMQKPDAKLITQSSVALWDDDVYLKAGDMETWLMYDFDDLGSAPSTPHCAIDGKAPISNSSFSDIDKIQQQLNCIQEELGRVREVISCPVVAKSVADLPTDCDTGYFSSYSDYKIHHTMLSDRVRTESYRDAILKNSDLFEGKTVLDVGCGTAILSMFSAKAGAKKVVGVDQSEVVYRAMDIIRENNYLETIDLVKGRIEDIELPVDKVDVIVSEWMGYFLLYEGMLDSVIHARDHYLAPDGLILPNKCRLNLVGCSDLEGYDKLINFWDNVYGFSMKCMKNDIVHEGIIEALSDENILTEAVLLSEIDLKVCTTTACDFSSKFQLKAIKDGVLTCLAGYFDTFFDLPVSVQFSTGPQAETTHWKQTLFFLKDCIEMKSGDVIEGSLTCSRRDVRYLLVAITLGNKKYKYIVE